jgi:hypothetical protein
MKKSFLTIIFFMFFVNLATAQSSNGAVIGNNGFFTKPYFRELVIRSDTSVFYWSKDTVTFNGSKQLRFFYTKDNAVCEISLYPHDINSITNIRLMPSGDYLVIDSLTQINNEYFRVKIQFNSITNSELISLNFQFTDAIKQERRIYEVPIFAYTNTQVQFFTTADELYIGEEKIFELATDNPKNVRINGLWTSGEDIDYRTTLKGDNLRLHLLPNKTGLYKTKIRLKTIKPFLDDKGKPTFDLPLLEKEFQVKVGRLAFLNVDRRIVTLDEEGQKGIEIQIDYNRNLVLQKTYRIENQEEPGGALVGELFTRSMLSNDKVLCWLRIYAYHKQSEGYLYLKDGDKAKFITNFGITPKTSINKISVLREGKDYTENLTVYPGETVEIRVEGIALDKANFQFEDLTEVRSDSVIRNESVAVYKLNIPVNVSKRKLAIFNNGIHTGYNLNIREYQRAKPLDFLQISYGEQHGEKNVPINSIQRPIMYLKTLQDVVFSARPEKIDSEKRIYGKQYLNIEIKITGERRELVELRNVDIVVCPGDNSPRYAFYDQKDCMKSDLSLNSLIGRKTNQLDDWSRIEITVKHRQERHDGEGYTQRIEIILERKYSFDIDVSFPAGLLTIVPELRPQDRFRALGGVSLAAIAQFTFFKPGRIAVPQPYRFGMGTLAINAFDFSNNANNNRDLSLVGLFSISPVKPMRLRITLYAGGGYTIRQSQWFVLLGPGVGVRI